MYYPLSQITTNLYTNGGEYQIQSTNENYIGYYWRTSDDKFFTGKTPQDVPNERLILSKTSIQAIPESVLDNKTYIDIIPNDEYLVLKNINTDDKILVPTYSPNIPTIQDYQIGEYRRYFCKKTNENIYLEINKNTYDKLVSKDPTIIFQYYQPFNIPWKIIGNIRQTYLINKNIVELTMKRQKLPMFDKYLKEDYLKYYQ